MREVIYALSADPITYGHLNIIDRALKTFDRVLVGIGINPKKKYTFSLDERDRLTKKVLAPYGDRVTIKPYSGLLADFAYENEIHTIVRGARNAADFDFEKLLADINMGFKQGIETFIMIADQNLSHISSSAVKELQEHQAKNVSDYVPLVVKEALELRVSGQFRVGVTGGIGCGKSYVETELEAVNRSRIQDCIPEVKSSALRVHCIDMDKIGRYILKESTEPIHQTIRKDVAAEFGKDLLVDGVIDVKHLLKLLFDDSDSMQLRSYFEDTMAEPTMHLVRKKLVGIKGIVLISSAIFVETGMCDLVNNNFIFVSCPDDVRIKRLKKRGYTDFEINNRLGAQLTPEVKLDSIKHLIQEKSCGSVIEFNNIDNNHKEIEGLYNTLYGVYGSKL